MRIKNYAHGLTEVEGYTDNDIEKLFEFRAMLDSLKLYCCSETFLTEEKFRIKLLYNKEKLKQKLKEFKNKKLI